jgi:hypothetical protein
MSDAEENIVVDESAAGEVTILASIKDPLGIPQQVTAFDPTLLMHINSQLVRLHTLGVGPDSLPTIDATSTWSDYLEDSEELNLVKTVVYLRVRLLFDPPASSFVLNSLEQSAEEAEWRLNVIVDSGEEDRG